MSELISPEACVKYAEICRLRANRTMDIEQSLLFVALARICEQAATSELLAERRADQIKQDREDAEARLYFQPPYATGWVCPKCGTPYGPNTPECGRCAAPPVVTSTVAEVQK